MFKNKVINKRDKHIKITTNAAESWCNHFVIHISISTTKCFVLVESDFQICRSLRDSKNLALGSSVTGGPPFFESALLCGLPLSWT